MMTPKENQDYISSVLAQNIANEEELIKLRSRVVELENMIKSFLEEIKPIGIISNESLKL